MKILIVSGFLGAGKTTFIKELIRRTGKQLVILENEYGENNLDSRDLKQVGDLEIMEFMEGCICCSKKDSFANTLLAISASLEPEYLVVEPTGVGKLSSILSNVKKILYSKIELLTPVVVLSPENINQYKRTMADIYTDQIENAGHIIFSKIENTDKEILEDAKSKVRAINSMASILDVPYTTCTNTWWLSLLDCVTPSSNSESLTLENTAREEKTNSESSIKMNQFTMSEGELNNVTELILLLEDAIHGEFGSVIRAKGVLSVGREWLRYDLADRMYGIIKEESSSPITQNVFIGPVVNSEKIKARLKYAPKTYTQKKWSSLKPTHS